MACNKNHSDIQNKMSQLPYDQGGRGRHKCAACAYERGYQDGLNHVEVINLSQILDNLEESQAAAQRHKSPHEGYILGYYDGLAESYNQ